MLLEFINILSDLIIISKLALKKKLATHHFQVTSSKTFENKIPKHIFDKFFTTYIVYSVSFLFSTKMCSSWWPIKSRCQPQQKIMTFHQFVFITFIISDIISFDVRQNIILFLIFSGEYWSNIKVFFIINCFIAAFNKRKGSFFVRYFYSTIKS